MNMLSIAQIIVGIALIAMILVQERSHGSSGLFGGGGDGQVYQTRRGLEKILYGATIVGILVFAGLALAAFII